MVNVRVDYYPTINIPFCIFAQNDEKLISLCLACMRSNTVIFVKSKTVDIPGSLHLGKKSRNCLLI